VPSTLSLPLQALAVAGSHTSKLIVESVDGLATPWTRQKGAVTLVVPMVAAAATAVAAVIVAISEATPSSAVQSPGLTAATGAWPTGPLAQPASAIATIPIAMAGAPCCRPPMARVT
jgi:hypothetical protein